MDETQTCPHCAETIRALAPTDRIIVRLPYMEWAFLLSTGGIKLDWQ